MENRCPNCDKIIERKNNFKTHVNSCKPLVCFRCNSSISARITHICPDNNGKRELENNDEENEEDNYDVGGGGELDFENENENNKKKSEIQQPNTNMLPPKRKDDKKLTKFMEIFVSNDGLKEALNNKFAKMAEKISSSDFYQNLGSLGSLSSTEKKLVALLLDTLGLSLPLAKTIWKNLFEIISELEPTKEMKKTFPVFQEDDLIISIPITKKEPNKEPKIFYFLHPKVAFDYFLLNSSIMGQLSTKYENEPTFSNELSSEKAKDLASKNANISLLPFKTWSDKAALGSYTSKEYSIMLFSLCGLPESMRHSETGWVFSALFPLFYENDIPDKLNSHFSFLQRYLKQKCLFVFKTAMERYIGKQTFQVCQNGELSNRDFFVYHSHHICDSKEAVQITGTIDLNYCNPKHLNSLHRPVCVHCSTPLNEFVSAKCWEFKILTDIRKTIFLPDAGLNDDKEEPALWNYNCFNPFTDVISDVNHDWKGVVDKCSEFLRILAAKEFKTGINSNFYWELDRLFKESKDMNSGVFLRSESFFDEDAFNTFSSVFERLFRLQFHVYNLVEEKSDFFFLIILLNHLQQLYKSKHPTPEMLQAIQTWTIRFKIFIFYVTRSYELPDASSRKFHLILHYYERIKRFGSLHVQQVQYQERSFSALKDVWDDSNKKSNGKEVIQHFVGKLSLTLSEPKPVKSSTMIPKPFGFLGNPQQLNLSQIKLKCFSDKLKAFFVSQKLMEHLENLNPKMKVKVYKSISTGEVDGRIVSSSEFYGKKRFDFVEFQKENQIEEIGNKRKKQEFYGQILLFFSVKCHIQWNLAAIRIFELERAKKNSIWNLDFVSAIAEKDEDYWFYPIEKIVKKIPIIRCGNSDDFVILSHEPDSGNWLEKRWKELQNSKENNYFPKNDNFGILQMKTGEDQTSMEEEEEEEEEGRDKSENENEEMEK